MAEQGVKINQKIQQQKSFYVKSAAPLSRILVVFLEFFPGPGKIVFILISSVAFAITGILEKISETDLQETNSTLEISGSDAIQEQGRRYCDPPNMTAFAIYYESSEEASDDYDLLQNHATVFQKNVSLSDLEKHTGDIYSNCGFAAAFFPASFLTAKYKSNKVFLYFVLFDVLLKVLFLETSLPLQISATFRGFVLGVVTFSFFDMSSRFATSRRNSIISFSSVRHVGLAIGELLLAQSGNKRYILYIIAIIALLWFIICLRIEFGPTRNESEFQEPNKRSKGSGMSTPWKNILGSRPVWMTIAAIFGAYCGMAAIFIGMRLNLKYIYFLPVEILSAISGFLHSTFAVICGYFIDYLTEAQIVSVTTSRRMVVYVSHFIPSGFLFVLGFLGCGQTTPMIFYCLAIMTTGANYAGAFSSALDLAPKYSRQIIALSFTFGSLGAFFINYLLFYILTDQVFVSWRFTFSLNSLILLLTAIFFMLRGSGSVQPWNDPANTHKKERKKNNIEEGRVSVAEFVPKQRTKSIYMVEKKILKVLHVQEPDKFTRVRAYSTSLPNERSSANAPNIYRPSNKKRASIS